MDISYDQAKRSQIREQRGLYIADASDLFEAFHLTRSDEKHSDDEDRFISIGMLNEEVVLVVWTERSESRRIVTMWKANDKERKAYHRQRDRPG